LFHIIIALLKEYEEVEAERVIKDIGSALPYDNPEKIFETMIAWGRYAGLMDYNAKTGMVFVPEDGDAVEDAHI
jgi:NitT/TauT family transport system ATP-binding protein